MSMDKIVKDFHSKKLTGGKKLEDNVREFNSKKEAMAKKLGHDKKYTRRPSEMIEPIKKGDKVY